MFASFGESQSVNIIKCVTVISFKNIHVIIFTHFNGLDVPKETDHVQKHMRFCRALDENHRPFNLECMPVM